MAKEYVRSPINNKLYYTSRFFQLYPLNFDFNKRKKFRIVYFITMPLLPVLIVGLFAWSYKTKYVRIYKTVESAYGIMDFVINLTLMIFNILCMILVQKSSNQWEILFKSLYNNAQNKKSTDTGYLFYFIHIIQVVWISSEMCVYTIYNITASVPLHVSLIDKINIYIVQISALLMNGYVTCMKENIISVKYRFQQQIALITKFKATEKNDAAAFEKFSLVTEIDDILNFLVDILKGTDAFNNIYGLQILGLSAILMMFISNTFNSVIVLLSRTYVLGALWVKGYFAIALSVYGILVVSPCFETTRKFDEVIKVACKLLIELPHGLDDPNYKILKEKLVLLIKQLEFRKPYFSAAGFYEVNYSMFMYIFGGVTSFVVVYLQLQHKI